VSCDYFAEGHIFMIIGTDSYSAIVNVKTILFVRPWPRRGPRLPAIHEAICFALLGTHEPFNLLNTSADKRPRLGVARAF